MIDARLTASKLERTYRQFATVAGKPTITKDVTVEAASLPVDEFESIQGHLLVISTRHPR